MSAVENMSRKLDAEVAEKVMGWNISKHFCWQPEAPVMAWYSCAEDKNMRTEEGWKPSTSADAWLVVEEMRRRGWTIFIRYGGGELSTTCVKMYSEEGEVDSFVDLLPEAICRAALAALEATND